jgi:type II secretory pathway predicted ATPase ExeA
MYESFYGLRERPFELLPNPKFLYLTARQREALSNLQYGLTAARGLTVLIGEAGTGKTTLIQAAISELRDSTVKYVLLSNPTLTRPEFYEFLARSFGLSDEASRSKTQFLFELRRELQERHLAGVLSALIIDEAQSVPYELLEEVRLLSNVEMPTVKLLNVVLAGQPELAERLNETSLRQLKQRISLRCQLTAMDLTETAAYIAGRIRIAGGRPEQIFTRESISAVYAASKGLPRTVNVVCDNALLGGFAAQVRPINAAFVEEVCRDFDIRTADSEPPSGTGDAAAAASDATEPAAPQPPPPPAPAAPAAAPVEENPQPAFGTPTRKRRFSFF